MSNETKAPQPPAEAQPCGCGEATCVVPWEPGCGLGKSEQHAEAQAQGGVEACPRCKGNPGLDCNSFGRTAPPSAPVGVEEPLFLLRAGHWREVYVGHRCMRLEVTYEHAAWERLMEQVEAAITQQPAHVAPVGVVDVDALAHEIRRVDGEHSLGASALAEALVPHLARTTIAQQPAADKAHSDPDACPACNRAWAEHKIGYSASACKMKRPAAVDDAMVERACAAQNSWPCPEGGTASRGMSEAQMRFILSLALAAQQGGEA